MLLLASILIAILLVSGCTRADNGNTAPPEDESPSISEYVLVFSSDAEDEEGREPAKAARDMIKAQTGETVQIVTDKVAEKTREILVGPVSRTASKEWYDSPHDTFDWKIFSSGGKIVIAGGGCWALDYAISKLEGVDILKENLSIKGNIYGEQIFPLQKGANLRILDDNIWTYDTDTNAPAWEALGQNCTNAVRSRGLAEVVYAHMPDIFCAQEYSKKMHTDYMNSLLSAKGYTISYTPASGWNRTPIFYRESALTLLETGYLKYDTLPDHTTLFNNGESKSYQWAVFTHKATGKKFAVLNTHLWWKSESAQTGSNAERLTQAKAIAAEIQRIVDKHSCPVFITGDMNCNLNSDPMKHLLNAGCTPVWDVATVYGDPRSGWHQCDAEKFSRTPGASNKDDGKTSIDQFFIYNGGSTEIKTFYRIQAYFTVLLTDHYPNYADIAL